MKSRTILLVLLLLGACGAAEPTGQSQSSSDCNGDCRKVDPQFIKMMLFDNNPTSGTITGPPEWTRVELDGRCISPGSPEQYFDHSFFREGKYVAFDLFRRAIDNATSETWLWQGHIIPKRFIVGVNGNLTCAPRQKLLSLIPENLNSERRFFIYTNKNAFSRNVNLLPSHGGNNIVRFAKKNCATHIQLTPNNKVMFADTYVLIDDGKVETLMSRDITICMFRSTLASIGLVGMLTYPEASFVADFEKNIGAGGRIIVPWWRLTPFLALRYVKPPHSTWQQVRAQIDNERNSDGI